MPNAFAMLMLMSWPLVCFALLRRMPVERGLIWCILGGYLLLPPLATFDLPLIPPMDKKSIPSLCAFLIIVFMLHKKVPLLPEAPVGKLLVTIFMLSAIATVLTNGETVVYSDGMGGGFRVSGLSIHDLLSAVIDQTIILLPFLMGRALLASELGLRELLRAIMIGGLLYSVPALIEVRLSPQLNSWIYGFFQHDFIQMMRDGGFRPIVFLPHALWLAFFMFSALLSSAALIRHASGGTRMKMIFATIYLAGVLYLCKSLASQLYALAFLPLALFASPKMQIRATLILALIAISYPMLRNAELVPLDAIVERAATISDERARSLAYRFDMEQLLLGRAHDKPWFGWGGWGRNLILTPETGKAVTIPDGRWIIVFGVSGWLGYIAEMGLLALPLVLLWRRSRGAGPLRISPYAAPVALILAATMVDMLLNATLIPLTWLCAGALLGYAENPRLAADPVPAATERSQLFGKGPAIGRRRPKGRRTLL